MLKWSFLVFFCVTRSVFAQPAMPNGTARPTMSPAPLPSIPRPGYQARQAVPQATQVRALAWDSEFKETSVDNGALSASFVFNATNISSADAIITGTQTSCGCTVAKLPAQPWVLAPGSNGQIQVTINLAGKTGTVNKTVTVLLSNQPPQVVSIKVNIAPPPAMSEDDRARNLQLAKADVQAIFKGTCADCHLTPSRGRLGAGLYDTLCGICHEASPDRRASIVPNLHSLKKPTDYEFWKSVITNGKTNSLMPAFATERGGPLTEGQIHSLAEYLARNISRNYQRPMPVGANFPTNASRLAPVPSIPGLKPLPPLKKQDTVMPPPRPVVPPVTPPPPPPNSGKAQ